MTESAASTDDAWTVQKILQWTTDFLQRQDVESPRLEAELLLAHARNCQRIRLYTDFETPLTEEERSRMRGFVQRRAKREPLAYITGRKEFYGRDFAVGSGVLVPRPETESLIDVCLERIQTDRPARLCEIGFGSGSVAVTLAMQRPLVTVTACDISTAARTFAEQNVALHDVAGQVQLVTGDGFEAIRAVTQELFDGIVSNPPYIREDELPKLAPEVVDHEPHEALVSGVDGLSLVRNLIRGAPGLLRPCGWMALELDPAQCDTVARLFADSGFRDATINKDLFGRDRIVAASWPG